MKGGIFMKQQHRTLYLILVFVFALALPLFDILEYIQLRQMQTSYQLGYLLWVNRPFVMPFCSLCLGWSLIRFLGLQKTNFKIFIVFVVL